MILTKQIKQQTQTIFKKIDIFGQQISLSFREEELYKTSFGGFLSICIIGVVISFFYSNIISFFEMNQVSSNIETNFNEDPDQILVSPEYFMFAVNIDQTNFITNPYFNITLEQRIYIRDENGTQTKLPSKYIDLVPCQVDHFKQISLQYDLSFETFYEKYSMSNYLCPNLNDSLVSNLTISGSWTSTTYSFLKLSVSNCKNNTQSQFSWNPICKSQDDINSQSSFRFQILTTNFLINENVAHNFIEPYIAKEQFYSFVPNKMYVQSDIFFRPRTVIQDEGILMYSNENTNQYATRDHQDNREQVSFAASGSTNYGSFYFVRSPYSYTVRRSFLKLDTLLSYLGGFTQFMVVILGLFVKIYNRQHMILEIANDLYDFQSSKRKQATQNYDNLLITTEKGRAALRKTIYKPQHQNQLPKIESQQLEELQSYNQSDVRNKSLFSESLKVNIPQKIIKPNSPRLSTIKVKCLEAFEQFKIIVCQQYTIGMTFRLIVSQLFPFKWIQNEECQLLQQAITQVNKELDIQHIIKQYHELFKLKSVFFSQDQLTLFNFSKRPLLGINLDSKKRRSQFLHFNKDIPAQQQVLSQQFLDLTKSYSTIIGFEPTDLTQDQIYFNERLIKLLGGNIPYLLEQEIAEGSDTNKVNKSECLSVN